MPMFILYTNIVDTPPEFLSKASKLVSTLTGIDEARVCVIINDGLKMTFGGTTDACAIVQCHSIGLQSTEHAGYSAAIAKLLGEIGEMLETGNRMMVLLFCDGIIRLIL